MPDDNVLDINLNNTLKVIEGQTGAKDLINEFRGLVKSINALRLELKKESKQSENKPVEIDGLSRILDKFDKFVSEISKLNEPLKKLRSEFKDPGTSSGSNAGVSEFSKLENNLHKLVNEVKNITVKVDTEDAVKDIRITLDSFKGIAQAVESLKNLRASNVHKDPELSGLYKQMESLLSKIKHYGRLPDRFNEGVAKIQSALESRSKVVTSQPVSPVSIRDDTNKILLPALKAAQSSNAALKSLTSAVYNSKVLPPLGPGSKFEYKSGLSPDVISPKFEKTADDLARSLFKLQSDIVGSLKNGLKDGWKLVEDAQGKAFRLGRGKREWEVSVVDYKKLSDTLKNTYKVAPSADLSAGALVSAFKTAYINRESKGTSKDVMAAEVFRWFKRAASEDLSGMTESMKRLYNDISKGVISKSVDLKNISNLNEIYARTALRRKAEDELQRKEFVRKLSLPAVKITPSGDFGTETKYGHERSVATFARITTGLERLANEYSTISSRSQDAVGYLSKIRELPIRTPAGSVKSQEAEDVAKELVNKILKSGHTTLLKEGYRSAVALRKVERGELKPGSSGVHDFMSEVKDFKTLQKEAESLGVTALDVAKALDKIDFDNFYDLLNKVYTAGPKPYLETQASKLFTKEANRATREIASVKDDIIGLMPLVEPGRPKRASYNANRMKVFTKAYDRDLRPEEQKQHILDVNSLWSDIAKNAEKLGKDRLSMEKGYMGIVKASSLDVSDAASSSIVQLERGTREEVGSLRKLISGTMITASSQNIRGLAPGESYASIARQMSNVSNALSGGVIVKTPTKMGLKHFEIPSLISKTERDFIQQGKFGQKGYGLNVLTELRNTASTFEDQIVISGKLAKAFTQVVKPLVRPAMDITEAGTIGAIKTGYKQITPEARKAYDDLLKNVGEVSKTIQDMLGAPEEYVGRADIVKIVGDIENVTRQHRGENIDVQVAKLTETFLNHFGRKLTTRFGTKGVSVTAKELPSEIRSFEDYAALLQKGFSTKVDTGPGLGMAKIPKSMGALIAEMFPNAAPELKEQLVSSGNKFIIDLFYDASKGVVTPDEALKQSNLRNKVKDLLAGTTELTGDVVKDIEAVKNAYTSKVNKSLYVDRPIEARISSAGIAKRGLMNEVVEGVFNQLIGSTKDVTVLTQDLMAQRGGKPGEIKPSVFNSPETRKQLKSYMEALGYTSMAGDMRTKDARAMKMRMEAEFIKPGMGAEELKDAKEKLKQAIDFEKQFSVYTDVITESGKQIKSFVSPKFLQIVEEPNLFPGWSKAEMDRSLKGESLNFQALGAYAGVFGADSSMMKELMGSMSPSSREGLEAIRALRLLDPIFSESKKYATSSLKSVDLKDIKDFIESTGTIKELQGSVFDVSKYPGPFNLRVPTGIKGKKAYEDMYIPGPALRATYREDLMGGKVAPTKIGRDLANYLASAKKVDDVLRAMESGSSGIFKQYADEIKYNLVRELQKTYSTFEDISKMGQPSQENIEYMHKTIEEMKKLFSTSRTAEKIYITGAARSSQYQSYKPPTERESIEQYQSSLGKLSAVDRNKEVLKRMMDMLVGPSPKSLDKNMREIEQYRKEWEEMGSPAFTPPPSMRSLYDRYKGSSTNPKNVAQVLESFENRIINRRTAPTIFAKELDAGSFRSFAANAGIDITTNIQQVLESKMKAMNKARIKYYGSLAGEVFGKGKGVEQAFFSRMVPQSVTGKAVSAVVDKTAELTKFIATLKKHGMADKAREMTKILKDHVTELEAAVAQGLPVLKEGEIGLPVEMARKMEVTRAGKKMSFADLIKESPETAYAASLRFPVYGTMSVQPHAAKLMTNPLAKHAIVTPGAAPLDSTALFKIIGDVEKRIDDLVSQRETAWKSGDAGKAKELTSEIGYLLGAVKEAIPAFQAHEQKLDFDGDTLYVHAGQTEKSRQEIKKHSEAFAKDVTSVRSLFQTVFTSTKGGAAETRSLAEMAATFGKRHPKEKGFEFLTKPYIMDDVYNMATEDVLKALQTYNPSSKPGDTKDLSKRYMATDVLDEVISRAGLRPDREEDASLIDRYSKAIEASQLGLPEKTGESRFDMMRDLSDQIVRQRLYEQKYQDAVSGQLYKLHTGQTVEGINRLIRLSEAETGFGGGLLGKAPAGMAFKPSEDFLKRWPVESVALGGDPVQEFATRMNEIARFIVQKGMDEKHAGVKAVGMDIIQNVGKTSGAQIIKQIMSEESDQFKELAEFNEEIKHSAKLRLGALSTEELGQELRRFNAEAKVEGKSRDQLIDEITKQIDLEAVFEELFRQIKRQAVKGYVKNLKTQLEELGQSDPAKAASLRGTIERGGGFESYARYKIEQQANSEKGISVIAATRNIQPLYSMRTGMSSAATIAGRSKLALPMPKGMVLKGSSGEISEMAKRYQDVMKASHVLGRSIHDVYENVSGDVETLMAVSTIQNEWQTINRLESMAKKYGVAMGHGELPEGQTPYKTSSVRAALGAVDISMPTMGKDIWSRSFAELPENLKGGQGSNELYKEFVERQRLLYSKGIKSARDKLASLSQDVGIPMMTREEVSTSMYDFAKSNPDVWGKIDDFVRNEMKSSTGSPTDQDFESRMESIREILKFQVELTEQSKRISEAMRDIPFRKQYLVQSTPKLIQNIDKTPIQMANESRMSSAEAFARDVKARQDQEKTFYATIDKIYRGEGANLSAGDVRSAAGMLVQKDLSAKHGGSDTMSRAAIESVEDLSSAISDAVIERKRAAIKKLEGLATGKSGLRIDPNEPKFNLAEVYRASALEHGGGFGGVPQPEAILRNMLGLGGSMGLSGDAITSRGTFVHALKGQQYMRKYQNVQLEGVLEDVQNKLAGHFDILYDTAKGKRLVDVKSMSKPEEFNKLDKYVSEMNDLGMNLQQYLPVLKDKDKKLASKLEGYLGQVNAYLKMASDKFGENITGELLMVDQWNPSREMKIDVGEFDPGRYKKDLEALGQARAAFAKIMSAKSPEEMSQIMGYDFAGVVSEIQKLPDFGKFKSSIPTRSQSEIYGQGKPVSLSPEQVELYDRLTREYALMGERFSGGATESRLVKKWGFPGNLGAPPAGGGGGGGGDDDGPDDLRRKIAALIKKIRSGVTPDSHEILQLMSVWEQAMESIYAASDPATERLFDDLRREIENVVNLGYAEKGGFSEAKHLLQVSKKRSNLEFGAGAGISSMPEAVVDTINYESPEGRHTNLKAMYQAAIEHWGIKPSDRRVFGKDIAESLAKVEVEGPKSGIHEDIIKQVDDLGDEKRGKLFVKIWMHYRDAVNKYYLRQLDQIQKSIKEATSDDEAARQYAYYKSTINEYIGTIKRSLGKRSDIFTKRGPSGGKDTFVSPELAMLTGAYRTPEEIRDMSRFRSGMTGEFEPIFEKLVSDIDVTKVDKLTPPIVKVNQAFNELAALDPRIKGLLTDAEVFKRMGPEIVANWDFSKLIQGITQIRSNLEMFHKLRVGGLGLGEGDESYVEPIRKNIEDTIRYLKQIEKTVGPVGGTAGSAMGLIGVPSFLDSKQQQLLHKRNIAAVRDYFKKAASEGGAGIGEAFTYKSKIVDPASKQVLRNFAYEFRKTGESLTATGESKGIFSEREEDLIKKWQTRTGLGQAFRRVLTWGFASGVVWKSVSALQSMVDTVKQVEYQVATLRQVMSPLETDFEGMADAALDFARDFGQPTTQILDSMRIFAQQGLNQTQVLDRSRTAALAANVTTLNASDATEALTSAMKIYGREGEGSVKFLDAWSDVESKHAVTSGALANALKKSASAAKTSGVTFDELNGLITGIGETSRQTGKEIGTSLNFIFRRLQSQKGPENLATVGIPVVGAEGDVRSGFDILGDLASRWGELSNAQKLALAQALGGQRHYNSLIILMEHWDDVLATVTDSLNSKGAAERRNAIVMDTYAKKVEQLGAAADKLQVQFGKIALPVAKLGIDGLRTLLEILGDLPGSVKAVALAFAGLFTFMSKGGGLFDSIINTFRTLPSTFEDFTMGFTKEFKTGVFELFGQLPKGLTPIRTEGLKKIGDVASVDELYSIMGKAGYYMSVFGREWNRVLSDVAAATSVSTDKIAGGLSEISKGVLDKAELARAAGAVDKRAAIVAGIQEAAGTVGKGAAFAFDRISKYTGISAEALQDWSGSSTGFTKSVLPMAASMIVLYKTFEKAWPAFKRLALSASDYEKSMAPTRRKTDNELASIKSLGSEYDRLSQSVEDVNMMRKPGAMAKAVEREEYVSPLLATADIYADAQKFSDNLAKSNYNLVDSFDSLGNAVIKSGVDIKSYIDLMSDMKITERAKNEFDVITKYVEELSATGPAEGLKYQLKAFTKEMPVIGNIISKRISVSPAKEMEYITKDMNAVLDIAKERPLAPVDVILESYQKQLDESKGKFKDTYKDFIRTLRSVSTEGMTVGQIQKFFGSPELQKGYELIVKVNPKFKLAGVKDVFDWQDVRGTEVLRNLYKSMPFDFAGGLTKEMLKQQKIKPRDKQAFVGDYVIFSKEVLGGELDIAAAQGVLEYSDKLGWFVKTVGRQFGEIKEIPYGEVEKFVDAIFPVQPIENRLQENIDMLDEFVAGSLAGLTGFGGVGGLRKRTFDKEFNLGPRFFSDVPTNVLLQSTRGYDVLNNKFGEVGYKQDFYDEMKTYWIDPMKKLKGFLGAAAGRNVEGAEETPGGGFAPSLAEDIGKLMDVLRNNQIVLQYRAVLSDLDKQLEENVRTTQTAVAVEEMRNKYLVNLTGLLAGLPENLSDVNTGITDISKLTGQQLAMASESYLPPGQRTVTNAVQQYRTMDIERRATVARMEAITKAMVDVESLSKMYGPEGYGLSINAKDVAKYMKMVPVVGDKSTGLMLGAMRNIDVNTAASHSTLEEILTVLSGGPNSAEYQKKIEEYMSNQTKEGPQGAVDALFKMSRARSLFNTMGRDDLVGVLNDVMGKTITSLNKTYGVGRVASLVKQGEQSMLERINPFGVGFSAREYIARSIGGREGGLGGFMHIIDATTKSLEAGNQPTWFQKMGIVKTDWEKFSSSAEVKALQEESKVTKPSFDNMKMIMQLSAAYSAFQGIAERASNRKAYGLDLKIASLDKRRNELISSGADQSTEEMSKLSKEIQNLVTERNELVTAASNSSKKEIMGLIGASATPTLAAMGLSDDTLGFLGKGTLAGMVGAYGYSMMTGESVPKYISDLKEKALAAQTAFSEKGYKKESWWDKLKFGFSKEYREFSEARGFAAKKMKEEGVLSEKDKKEAMSALATATSPEAAQKAGETAKLIQKYGKSSDKQLSVEEQMLQTQQDQLLYSQGIYEEIKKSNDSLGKKGTTDYDKLKAKAASGDYGAGLRLKIDAKNAELAGKANLADMARDFLSVFLLTTFAGMSAEKLKPGLERSFLKDRADVREDLIDKMLTNHWDLIMKVMEAQAVKSAADAKKPGADRLMAEFVPFMDADTGLSEVKKVLESYFSKFKNDLDTFTPALQEMLKNIDLANYANKLVMELKDFYLGMMSGIESIYIEAKYRTAHSGEMAGIGAYPELSLGKVGMELSPTERLWKFAQSNPQMKQLMMAYKSLEYMQNAYIEQVKKSTSEYNNLLVSQAYVNEELSRLDNIITSGIRDIPDMVDSFGSMGGHKKYSRDFSSRSFLPTAGEFGFNALNEFLTTDVNAVAATRLSNGPVADFFMKFGIGPAKRSKLLKRGKDKPMGAAQLWIEDLKSGYDAFMDTVYDESVAGDRYFSKYIKYDVLGGDATPPRGAFRTAKPRVYLSDIFKNYLDAARSAIDEIILFISNALDRKTESGVELLLQHYKEQVFKSGEDLLNPPAGMGILGRGPDLGKVYDDIFSEASQKARGKEIQRELRDELFSSIDIPVSGDLGKVYDDIFSEASQKARGKEIQRELRDELFSSIDIPVSGDFGAIYANIKDALVSFWNSINESSFNGTELLLQHYTDMSKDLLNPPAGFGILGRGPGKAYTNFVNDLQMFLTDVFSDESRETSRRSLKSRLREEIWGGLKIGRYRQKDRWQDTSGLIGKDWKFPGPEDFGPFKPDFGEITTPGGMKILPKGPLPFGLVGSQEKVTTSADALKNSYNNLASTQEQLNNAVTKTKQTTESYTAILDPVNEKLSELKHILDMKLIVSGLITELNKLSSSIKISLESMNYDRTAFDKLIGGAHPLATTIPSAETVMGGMAVGMNFKQVLGMDKYAQASLANYYSGQPVTADQLIKPQIQKSIDMYAYEQRKEDEKLQKETGGLQELYTSAIRARESALQRGDTGYAGEIDKVVDLIRDRLERSPEKMTLYQARSEYDKLGGMLAAGGLSTAEQSLYKDRQEVLANTIKYLESTGKEKAYVGIGNDFNSLKDSLYKLLEVRGKEGLAINDLGIVQAVGDSSTNIVNAIQAGTLTLAKTMLDSFGKGAGGYVGVSDFLTSLMYSFGVKKTTPIPPDMAGGYVGVSDFLTSLMYSFGVKKTTPIPPDMAVGGPVFGSGNSTSDSIPARLSTGEFVLNSWATGRLGRGTLNYMNSTGRLPGFADGGAVPGWGERNPNLYGVYGGAREVGSQALSIKNWKNILGLTDISRIDTGNSAVTGWGERNPNLWALGQMGKEFASGAVSPEIWKNFIFDALSIPAISRIATGNSNGPFGYIADLGDVGMNMAMNLSGIGAAFAPLKSLSKDAVMTGSRLLDYKVTQALFAQNKSKPLSDWAMQRLSRKKGFSDLTEKVFDRKKLEATIKLWKELPGYRNQIGFDTEDIWALSKPETVDNVVDALIALEKRNPGSLHGINNIEIGGLRGAAGHFGADVTGTFRFLKFHDRVLGNKKRALSTVGHELGHSVDLTHKLAYKNWLGLGSPKGFGLTTKASLEEWANMYENLRASGLSESKDLVRKLLSERKAKKVLALSGEPAKNVSDIFDIILDSAYDSSLGMDLGLQTEFYKVGQQQFYALAKDLGARKYRKYYGVVPDELIAIYRGRLAAGKTFKSGFGKDLMKYDEFIRSNPDVRSTLEHLSNLPATHTSSSSSMLMQDLNVFGKGPLSVSTKIGSKSYKFPQPEGAANIFSRGFDPASVGGTRIAGPSMGKELRSQLPTQVDLSEIKFPWEIEGFASGGPVSPGAQYDPRLGSPLYKDYLNFQRNVTYWFNKGYKGVLPNAMWSSKHADPKVWDRIRLWQAISGAGGNAFAGTTIPGYKVYGGRGKELTPEEIKIIIEEMDKKVGMSPWGKNYSTAMEVLKKFFPALSPEDIEQLQRTFIAKLPSADTGGYVASSGLAEIHKGEYVLNPASSESSLKIDASEAAQLIKDAITDAMSGTKVELATTTVGLATTEVSLDSTSLAALSNVSNSRGSIGAEERFTQVEELLTKYDGRLSRVDVAVSDVMQRVDNIEMKDVSSLIHEVKAEVESIADMKAREAIDDRVSPIESKFNTMESSIAAVKDDVSIVKDKIVTAINLSHIMPS